MKNLFLLPTDKPSRLWVNNLKRRLELDKDVLIGSNTAQHIYFTNDEEIKDDEWHLHYYEGKPVISKSHNGASDYINLKAKEFGYKKIILTTDQDLIKNGIQKIDDEFLEWFIKNPSCEKVEVDCWTVRTKDKIVYEPPLKEYEIIISQKESKEKTNDSSLKLLQVMELVELALQNGSIHPNSFIIRNAVRECIGLEPIK